LRRTALLYEKKKCGVDGRHAKNGSVEKEKGTDKRREQREDWGQKASG